MGITWHRRKSRLEPVAVNDGMFVRLKLQRCHVKELPQGEADTGAALPYSTL